jgi:hypothetical protein
MTESDGHYTQTGDSGGQCEGLLGAQPFTRFADQQRPNHGADARASEQQPIRACIAPEQIARDQWDKCGCCSSSQSK